MNGDVNGLRERKVLVCRLRFWDIGLMSMHLSKRLELPLDVHPG